MGDEFEGKTQLYFSFEIDPQEMAKWSAERIRQFFAGIAKMLEAVNG